MVNPSLLFNFSLDNNFFTISGIYWEFSMEISPFTDLGNNLLKFLTSSTRIIKGNIYQEIPSPWLGNHFSTFSGFTLTNTVPQIANFWSSFPLVLGRKKGNIFPRVLYCSNHHLITMFFLQFQEYIGRQSGWPELKMVNRSQYPASIRDIETRQALSRNQNNFWKIWENTFLQLEAFQGEIFE